MIVKQATQVLGHDNHRTSFSCGCVWCWWVGKPSALNNRWEKQCKEHASQERPVDHVGRECVCLNVGEDDGATTCWMHHDCFNSDCTHMDIDNFDDEEGIFDED